MKVARADDYGLPNLAAEVRFWQKAFGLEDWMIVALHVDEPRYRCKDAGPGYPNIGERMAGLCDADIATRTARIQVQTPRTQRRLRYWPLVVCHEVMHVLGAAYRTTGWTIEKEHQTINMTAPSLVKMKAKDPAHAQRMAANLAKAVRAVSQALTTKPTTNAVERAAAMKTPPPERGPR